MSAPRISRIATIFVGLSALVSIGVYRLMIEQHEIWLERSYLNRWAFRDVPTKRGSILDREGRVELSHDVPGFDLELRFRTFRRAHPIGTAVHGANLLRAITADPVAPYELTHVARLPAACSDLLSMPLAVLAAADRDDAADLRFYASSLLASLTDVDAGRFARALSERARAGAGGRVLDVAAAELAAAARGEGGPAPAAATPSVDQVATDLSARFRERVQQLSAIAARLRADHGGFDLFSALEERRRSAQDWRDLAELPDHERECLAQRAFWTFLDRRAVGAGWIDWRSFLDLPAGRRDLLLDGFLAEQAEQAEQGAPAERDQAERAGGGGEGASSRELALPWLPFRDESMSRSLCRRIDYQLAAWIGLLEEHHKGLLLRPSVRRERADTGDLEGLASLGLLIGRARDYWASDEESDVLDSWLARVFEDVDRRRFFAEGAEWLPPDLEDSVWRGARATVRHHLRSYGRVGGSGIEAEMNDVLSGTPGLRWVERTKLAREQRMFQSLDVLPGQDLRLTVDLRLQRIAEAIVRDLGESPERAMVVVDPKTGDVLAIAGYSRLAGTPATEPQPQPQPQWSFAASYPNRNPNVGSVVKPFMLLEYLEELSRSAEIAHYGGFVVCEEKYKGIPGTNRVLRCDGAHGDVARDPVHALGESCNVFFFQVAEAIGQEGLERALARVGWLTDRWQPVKGLLVQAAPELAMGEAVLQMRAIGYGVRVSALQVARAFAGLASGSLPTLSLVVDEAPRPAIPLGVDRAHLAMVRQGLHACVESGTAEDIPLRAYGVAGKTGTAEVRRRTGDQIDLNNAWFAGYVGEDQDARLAFAAVAYRDPGHGGAVAGRMVADFLAAVAADEELARSFLGRGR